MPLCALSEFSRGFMMATMMSGLFICGQTDHSNDRNPDRPGGGAGDGMLSRITSVGEQRQICTGAMESAVRQRQQTYDDW